LQQIRDLIREPFFVHKYLNRIKDNSLSEDIVVLNLLEENATSIDWIILNNIVDENWIDFNIFGLKIGNGTEFFNKAVAIIAVGFAIFNYFL
tara:strand:- start:131 stop:406 length:276 start_codon:yes stop_codon:yes gene_type:complete